MYSALTYDVMKSYLTRVWDKKIRNDYITLETKVVIWYIKFWNMWRHVVSESQSRVRIGISHEKGSWKNKYPL